MKFFLAPLVAAIASIADPAYAHGDASHKKPPEKCSERASAGLGRNGGTGAYMEVCEDSEYRTSPDHARAVASQTASKKTPSPATIKQKAFGVAVDPDHVTRVIAVEMSDAMRFSPSNIQVKQGETIKFVVKNNGKAMHEMVIGTIEELKAHADMMRKFPNMAHAEAYMAHVTPGNTEEIVWRFNRPGNFNFACLVAGHFEAGMMGDISVAGDAPVSVDSVRRL